ncbi:MAG TPA: polyketide synthase dehydratase domain-containing protein, partial [Polyangiaceae bacterium]|nr:polyketide synthase dehydratase domain-containing protein [Polyangiaceae bacterium]
ASDWYFKAHFFQDPVQPGSLGIEALIQLLQCFMLQTGMADGIEGPRFEPIAIGLPMTWKYRGQVVPKNKRVTSVIEITEVGRDDRGPFAVCDASLWVDGIRIYDASKLAMRIVAGAAERQDKQRHVPLGDVAAGGSVPRGAIVIDPQRDRWIQDHCPTWNRPALPLMHVVELLAGGVEGKVTGLKDVQVKGWLDFTGPRSFHTTCEARGTATHVTLWSTPRDDLNAKATEVASARVLTGDYKPPPAALTPFKAPALEDPYASGALFHGEAFHLLERAARSDSGVSSVLDAGAGAVPIGKLHPALLDAALHGIPHDALHSWSSQISEDKVAYPARILELELYAPTPTAGPVRCEVRFDGFLAAPDLPRFRVQLSADGRVWAEFSLVEACFPKGPLGAAAPSERRAFLRDKHFVPGVRLSRSDGAETRLSQPEVEASDWMPGTIVGIYGTTDAERIAVLEHVAAREGIHPAHVPGALPLNAFAVHSVREGRDVVVRDTDPARRTLDPTPLRAFWDQALGMSDPWLGRDLWEGLLKKYVRRVVLADPEAFRSLEARSALFLGNHQVQIESLLITNILSGLTGRSVVTMANAKHEKRWIGWILRHMFSHPGSRDPGSILYFDQGRPESMFEIISGLKPQLSRGDRSLFLHPQGTRSQSCRETTTKLSSVFLDLALELDLPIVPIRFSGGLPVTPVVGKLEFPHGHAAQDYFLGRPIEAEELRALPYAARAAHVLDAIAALGEPAEDERPDSPDIVFSDAVTEWQRQTQTSEVEAVFFRILEQVSEPSAETERLLDGIRAGAVLSDPWLARLASRLSGKGA